MSSTGSDVDEAARQTAYLKRFRRRWLRDVIRTAEDGASSLPSDHGELRLLREAAAFARRASRARTVDEMRTWDRQVMRYEIVLPGCTGIRAAIDQARTELEILRARHGTTAAAR